MWFADKVIAAIVMITNIATNSYMEVDFPVQSIRNPDAAIVQFYSDGQLLYPTNFLSNVTTSKGMWYNSAKEISSITTNVYTNQVFFVVQQITTNITTNYNYNLLNVHATNFSGLTGRYTISFKYSNSNVIEQHRTNLFINLTYVDTEYSTNINYGYFKVTNTNEVYGLTNGIYIRLDCNLSTFVTNDYVFYGYKTGSGVLSFKTYGIFRQAVILVNPLGSILNRKAIIIKGIGG